MAPAVSSERMLNKSAGIESGAPCTGLGYEALRSRARTIQASIDETRSHEH